MSTSSDARAVVKQHYAGTVPPGQQPWVYAIRPDLTFHNAGATLGNLVANSSPGLNQRQGTAAGLTAAPPLVIRLACVRFVNFLKRAFGIDVQAIPSKDALRNKLSESWQEFIASGDFSARADEFAGRAERARDSLRTQSLYSQEILITTLHAQSAKDSADATTEQARTEISDRVAAAVEMIRSAGQAERDRMVQELDELQAASWNDQLAKVRETFVEAADDQIKKLRGPRITLAVLHSSRSRAYSARRKWERERDSLRSYVKHSSTVRQALPLPDCPLSSPDALSRWARFEKAQLDAMLGARISRLERKLKKPDTPRLGELNRLREKLAREKEAVDQQLRHKLDGAQSNGDQPGAAAEASEAEQGRGGAGRRLH